MQDAILLLARILLMLLFLVFGWNKLTQYDATVSYMAQTGLPFPSLAALVAIAIEFFLALVIVVGAWTRPLAVLFALYSLATALTGHHFWTMEGATRYANAINFYKNLGLTGGFLLLYVTGPGRYSLDARRSRSVATQSR